MQQVRTINGRRAIHSAHRRAAGRWVAHLATVAMAGLGSACLAAESISGLGSAFRPQGVVNAPPEVGSDRAVGSLSGVRVVVASPGRTLASIDGQIVRVGDIVNGMRVAQIDPQGVLLVGEGGVRERVAVSPSVTRRERPADASRVSNGVRQ
jgi:hypothetical protein